MARLLVFLIGLLVSSVVMSIAAPEGVAFVVSSGLMIGFAIPLLDTLIIQFRFLTMVWYSIRT